MTDDESSDDEELTDLAKAVSATFGVDSEESIERVDELRDDPSTDFDAQTRQDAGWLRLYVECPDCQVPMARTTTQSSSVTDDDDVTRVETQIHAVCPECREVMSVLDIEKRTGLVGDLTGFNG